MTNKPKAGDKITIQVSFGNRFEAQESVEAVITYVADSGRVFFKPLKQLLFVDYKHHPEGIVCGLHKDTVYSTDDFRSGELTGRFKEMLFISKHTFPTKPRKVDVALDAPTMKLEDIPKHEMSYTSKLDENGHTSSVVDGTNEFFKAFASGTHHCIPPHIKINSLLTGFCEDAKKKAEEFKEAVLITDRVVSHGDIEYTVRMMLKAGLSPHQIAEEIQRQFYNAMVEE